MSNLLATCKQQGKGDVITLCRPAKRNALSRDLMRQLSAAFDQAARDDNARAVVLRAEGPAFCAGMDLAEMLDTRDAPDSSARWQADADAYRDLLLKIVRLPKPTIASVQGPALAGGLGLVLACDVVVASERATFGLPEPKRGLVAAVVAPFLLLRIGAGRAGYLLLTAGTIDAAAAGRLGIAHEVVPAAGLASRTEQLVAEIAEAAPEALRATKRFLQAIAADQLAGQAEAGAAESAAARATPEAREGLQAFLEKRKPRWDVE
jgi:methylglutaconyl-CoA hydratase